MKKLLVSLAGAERAAALVQSFADAARERGIAHEPDTAQLAALLAAAYPALRAQMLARPEDVVALTKGKLRLARDLRAYRRLAASAIGGGDESTARALRQFANRERLRIAARELLAPADIDATARELADLAQVCVEIAVAEAQRAIEERFGVPTASAGARCAFTVLGMGKLGGRELNAGSDVDLIPFYETDDGDVRKDGAPVEQTLHEHFTRVTQRFTQTLEEATGDGIVWRVDLRLRPEGSRGPLVNALAAAERYYETWGRTWERAALLRARPVAGDLAFGARLLDALGPFVWRKAVDPKIAREMTELVLRGRAELTTEPERDVKLGPGGIREAEFFVQSLQLIWGGKEPALRVQGTIEALRRLHARGFVTDRESREVESSYLALRRVEHRVQNATGIQTHVLPRGELLETIAKSLGDASGAELEKELDKIRRRVAARFASLTKTRRAGDDDATRLAPLFAALDSGVETLVVTALAELASAPDADPPASTIDVARAKPTGAAKRRDTPPALHEPHVTADVARHLLALARSAELPLGTATRDRHPALARAIVDAIAGAADPEQAARLLASFFSRLGRPGLYAHALADDLHSLHKLVALFGASAFLGEALVGHPGLADSVVFTKGTPTPEHARREVDVEVANANVDAAEDPGEALVSALRRAKARLTVEVGIAELAGELSTREATLVLTAIADATLDHATRLALAERSIEDGGLSVVAMGKLGGREIGYGSDLDVFFVYDTSKSEHAEKYVRAAQRVLRLVSAPHGDGPGYELDTRLRPSGSHGLLVVSLEAFARYHGLAEDGASLADAGPEAHDWERQALVKSRACAGDAELGTRVSAMAAKIAYERPAPDPQRVNHLRMRMENELAQEGPRVRAGTGEVGPTRFDVKLGRGGIVDVEFAVQWLQMRYGADRRVRTTDTETALSALEACGYLDVGVAAVLREGYGFLRRLEQALRVVHGTSASLIQQGAPGLPALARRMGFREGKAAAAEALLERYLTVTRDVRAAYVTVLGLETKIERGDPKNPL